jgi:hypothetical protein
MAAEQVALAAMLVVRTNAARAAARVAAGEEVTRAAEEAAAAVAARAEEIVEEAAAAREEMARDRACWDKDMVAARCAREIHELVNERRHRQLLARRQAHRAH